MKWKIITFDKVTDKRGSLVFIEQLKDIPFDIKRVYYIYDLDPRTVRGDHAHRELEQVMIAVHGRFTLELFDGVRREIFVLDDPSKGVYIPKLVWCRFYDFDPETVILVLASDYYKPEDYIRDFDEFMKIVRKEGDF